MGWRALGCLVSIRFLELICERHSYSSLPACEVKQQSPQLTPEFIKATLSPIARFPDSEIHQPCLRTKKRTGGRGPFVEFCF